MKNVREMIAATQNEISAILNEIEEMKILRANAASQFEFDCHTISLDKLRYELEGAQERLSALSG